VLSDHVHELRLEQRMSLKINRLVMLSAVAVLFVSAAQARAGISITLFGASSPPLTLGGYTMTPFASDPSAVGSSVSILDTPLGGHLAFSDTLTHSTVGNGWPSWTNGYTGDVYFDQSGGTLKMTLTPDVGALYFYVAPDDNSTGPFKITVTASDGSASQFVSGQGNAKGFGLFGTSGATISTVTVQASTDLGHFAIGEFGVAAVTSADVTSANPEPSTLALLGMGAATLAGYRGWRRRKQLVAA
jgi:hypothetical protein